MSVEWLVRSGDHDSSVAFDSERNVFMISEYESHKHGVKRTIHIVPLEDTRKPDVGELKYNTPEFWASLKNLCEDLKKEKRNASKP